MSCSQYDRGGSELGEALEVVARDATLVLEADPGIMIHSLDGRRLRHNGPVVEVALDDLVSRRQVEPDNTLRVDPARIDWEYAGRHPQMLQLVDELEQTADRHRVSFAAHELKGERFAAYSRREGKDIMGRRVRV